MFGPLHSDEAMERPVKMDFDPEIPGSDDGEKKQQIRPPKKRAKPYPRLAIKDRQRGKGRRRKKQSMRTFDQTCEGGENPESGKPGAPLMPLLEPSQPAINRPGKERGKEWFRHNYATENECTA